VSAAKSPLIRRTSKENIWFARDLPQPEGILQSANDLKPEVPFERGSRRSSNAPPA
jgi:hypothetical protein